MPTRPEYPSVSVIMAVYNEADFIDDTVSDLLGQDYEGPLEVIVADGGSTDGTKDRLQKWAERDDRLTVIDNPERRQAFGLNFAADRATGKILVRADGHTRFAPNYVSASVGAIQETRAAVGGRMVPVGRTPFGRAVAAAMMSPLIIGPGKFHHATVRGEVDTVYLGAFLSEEFQIIGGYRSFPSGAAEDADFYFRWRDSGGHVIVDPGIESTYAPRDHVAPLWRQYFRYGAGKAEMVWLNGRLPSFRFLAPIGLVTGLLAMGTWGLVTGVWWPFAVLIGSWLLLLGYVGVSASQPAFRVIAAGAIMHVSYGLGTMSGLARGRGRADHQSIS
jgi:succinoglycan biosynthesis protein ExoA